MKQNITIIGGTDGFGKWLAEFSIEKFAKNIHLTITGRNKIKGEKIAKELGCKFTANNIDAVKNADITIFSTPISIIEENIKKIAPHLKKGSLVSDVCSIKKFPSLALKKYSAKGVLVVPTHPMFGPSIGTIVGQIFVLTPMKTEDTLDLRYVFLKNFLENSGAKVIESTPTEHDKMMAVVQGLTHFNMFVLGETIKRLGIDVERSLDFVSPIYKMLLSSVGRYIYQHPKLHGDIQMYNDEVLNVHKIFKETTNDFNKFVEQKDEDSFINTILGTHEYFGETAKKGQIYTDKIIYLISKQIESIENNIGKKITLLNIYSKERINGIIEKYNNEIIYLKNGKKYDINLWYIKENK